VAGFADEVLGIIAELAALILRRGDRVRCKAGRVLAGALSRMTSGRLSHVRAQSSIDSSDSSMFALRARLPRTFAPRSTTGSHRQLSESATPTSSVPQFRVTTPASSYPRPSARDSAARTISNGNVSNTSCASRTVSTQCDPKPRVASPVSKTLVSLLVAPTTRMRVSVESIIPLYGESSTPSAPRRTAKSRMREHTERNQRLGSHQVGAASGAL
jgi:hypothetical protein